MLSKHAPPSALWCLALLIGACLIGIAALGDLRRHLALFVLLFFVAFGAYLGAVAVAARQPQHWSGRPLLPILGFALFFRLVVLAAPPTLSDDLFRYAWEGRVLASGQSPYRYAPDDPALVLLRDDAIWGHVNNLDIPSPYPPLAQLGGLIGVLLTPHSPWGVKLVSTLADVATAGALLYLLRVTGRPLACVLVYAWHPLVLVAFAHSGHNDSLMLAPLTLAAAFAARADRWRTAALVAVAALAKVTPLLLLLPLARRVGAGPAALAAGIIAAAWVPFLWLGGGAIGSIATYLGQWADNDSLHAVIRQVAGAPAAKATCLALLAAGVAVVAFRPALARRPFWWQAYVIPGLSIVLASTVHAWYLTWLLPFLAMQVGTAAAGDRPLPQLERVWRLPAAGSGWLLFSGLVALPYLTYDTHEWRLWISFMEYIPLFLLLAAGVRWPSLRLAPIPFTPSPAAASD